MPTTVAVPDTDQDVRAITERGGRSGVAFVRSADGARQQLGHDRQECAERDDNEQSGNERRAAAAVVPPTAITSASDTHAGWSTARGGLEAATGVRYHCAYQQVKGLRQ